MTIRRPRRQAVESPGLFQRRPPAPTRVVRFVEDFKLVGERVQFIRGLRSLIEALELDVLAIDTHPGLNEEMLLVSPIVLSHAA